MSIKIKVYEEIKCAAEFNLSVMQASVVVEWVDNNGINTPYKISYVGGQA